MPKFRRKLIKNIFSFSPKTKKKRKNLEKPKNLNGLDLKEMTFFKRIKK